MQIDLDAKDIAEPSCEHARIKLLLDSLLNYSAPKDIWRLDERLRKPLAIPNLTQFENNAAGFTSFGRGASIFQIERLDLKSFRGGPVRPRCMEILGTEGVCDIQVTLTKDIGVRFSYPLHNCRLENVTTRIDSVLHTLRKNLRPAAN